MEKTLILDEQIGSTAQPAEAEQTKGANRENISLGKFKDVNALLNAYNSLEAEFTKRCQRIKELEGKNDKVETPFKEEEVVEVQQVQDAQQSAQLSEEQKQEVLKDYLKEILQNKQRAIILDDRGVGARTPVVKPKTIAEAGAMAKEIL